MWIFLVVVAFWTTQSVYTFDDAAALAVLYALFAVALLAGARAVASRGGAGLPVAALTVGVVLAWHLREQTRVAGTGATLWTLEGIASFVPVAIGFAVAYLLLEVFTGRRRRDHDAPPATRRHVVVWALATALFFALLGGVYSGSNSARWHLIRHNQMIGTLAFHLFGTPVAEIEAEQWAAHLRGAPRGQPQWVLDLYETTAGPVEAPVGDTTRPPGERDQPGGATLPPGANPRPDIVVVMLDTLRADALTAYGGDPTWMPGLNGLAERALVFSDVIANAPWTQPSVASFFTGVLPEEHGVISYPFRLSAGVVTLAEVLRAQGYKTVALVANGVIANPDSGFVRGFDRFEYLSDPERPYARADRVTDAVAGLLAEPSTGGEAAAAPRGAGRRPEGAERAPLFLYVHYFDPHVPYLSSGLNDRQRAALTIDSARRYYHDELRFLDGELERLAGILDDALPGPRALLVISDHGEEFGEHDGLGHSQTLYSEVLQVPAILQLRGATPSGTIDARLEGRDFFDLLVRLGAGERLDIEAWATGAERSARVASLYFEKDPGRSERIHYLLRPYRDRIYDRMIQRDGRRYIWSAFGPTDELYDLTADPGERRNLADHEADRVTAMRDELDQSPPYWVQLVALLLADEALENLRQLGYIR